MPAISKITTIAGNSASTTAGVDISGSAFSTSTSFNGFVANIKSTSNGYIVFNVYSTTNGGLYIASTKRQGTAYGINMSVGTIYKVVSYSSSTLPTLGNSPAAYGTATANIFSIVIDPSTNDIYAYEINLPSILCIPYVSRTNDFTNTTLNAGYVHILYKLTQSNGNHAEGAYDIAFNSDGHLFTAMTNIGQVYMIARTYVSSTTISAYGNTIVGYAYSATAPTIRVQKYITVASPISICFDSSNVMYVTGAVANSVSIFPPDSTKTYTVLNRSLSATTLFTFNTPGTLRGHYLAVDPSKNLFCTNSNGDLYIMSSASTLTNIMGIDVSAGNIDTPANAWKKLIANNAGASLTQSDLSLNDTTNIKMRGAIGGTYYFSLDTRNKRTLFLGGYYAVRMIVSEPSPPSYITTTVLSGTIQISELTGDIANNYNLGFPLTTNYYSIDGGSSYTSVPASTNTVTTSTLPSGTYNVKVISKNIVGNSDVYATTVSLLSTPIQPTSVSLTLVKSGNIQVSVSQVSPPANYYTNGVSYYYYLYSGGTNNSTNVSSYTGLIGAVNNSSYPDQTTYIDGLINQPYTVYVIAQNATGSSVAISQSIDVFTTPTSPTISTAVSTVAKQLTITLTDSATYNATNKNSVSYFYSLDGATYGNSGNAYAPSSTFTITNIGSPGTIDTISNTLYVRSNGNAIVGNSAPVSRSVIVYQIPSTPTTITVNSPTQSGNLSVSITDTPSLTNYASNNVFYHYYLYNGTGTNQSADNTLYSNSLVGYNSAGATITLTNQTAQTYTLYVIAKNTVGNSVPPATGISATVLTTPVNFDSRTVSSTTSGNIDFTITDTTNSLTNSIKYLYYLYDTGTNSSTTIGTYSDPSPELLRNSANQGPYTYRLSGLSNKQYTLYLTAKNNVGNTVSVSNSIMVYTTPLAPTAVSTTNIASGNLRVVITDPNNSTTNGIYYYYYVYALGAPSNTSTQYDTYTKYSTAFTASPTTLYIDPLVNNTYTVYILAQNSTGNSSPISSTATVVYTTPLQPSINSATASTSAQTLNVIVDDVQNLPTNQVYYWYSTDGSTYSNSQAVNATNQTSFTIPLLTDVSYTLSVRGNNPIGYSSSDSRKVIVYQVPRRPTAFAWDSTTKEPGNLTVNITETTPPAYYNLNNVYYYYYLYDGVGNDQSGNILAYSNSAVKLATNDATTATFPITGKTAQTYTLYVIGVNSVGNSLPSATGVSANVYTVPSALSIVSTSTPRSGNLTVSFTDPNDSRNEIYYYYYALRTGDPNNSSSIGAYSNSQVKLVGGTNSITIPSLLNAEYTVYVLANNPVGNSVAVSTVATVYTTPSAPNTVSITNVASGNLQVSVSDSNNASTNGIYYYYYAYRAGTTDNSTQYSAYSNSRAILTSSSTTQFFIDGLTNASYKVYVITNNPVGNSLSAPISTSTVMVYTLPSAPTIDTANTISPTSGQITVALFDSVNLATNNVYYWYSIGDETNYANSAVKYTGISTQYSFPVSGLTNGVPYTIYTRASNPIGNSTSVFTASIMVYDVPSAPVLLDAIPRNQQIDISFSTPNNQGNAITSYNYSVNGSTYIDIGLPTNNQYQILSGLTNEQPYSVSVRAKNARGNSLASNVITVTPYGVPDAPVIYGVPYDTTIDVSFDTPNNHGGAITQYQVSCTATDTLSFSNVSPVNNKFSISTQTTNGGPLVKGTKYYIRMRAVNGVGSSTSSNTVLLAPGDLPTEPVITTIIPLDGQIQFVFTPPSNDGGNDVISYKYAVVPL